MTEAVYKHFRFSDKSIHMAEDVRSRICRYALRVPKEGVLNWFRNQRDWEKVRKPQAA